MRSLPKTEKHASLGELAERLSRALRSEPAERHPRAREPAAAVAMPPLSGGRRRRDRRAHTALDLAAERARKRLARDVRREAEHARRMADWGAQTPAGGWRHVPVDVWVMAWSCMSDATGGTLRYWMGQERNKIAVGAARRVALRPDAGTYARSWYDPTARALMTVTLVLLRLGAPTRRKGPFTECVRGVGLGALAAMLSPPGASARVPHRNTLCGRHKGLQSDWRRGQTGYLRSLAHGGVLYSQQLPAHEVEPFERGGPSGHACNRYWLLGPTATGPEDQARREALIALHREGQGAAHEDLPRPSRPPRYAAESRAQLAGADPPEARGAPS